MKILAFETSCDDTAVGVVQDGVHVLAHKTASQIEHNVYGGVVPEIAARLHSERWREVMDACLAEAKLSIEDIDALAVTQGPGLQTSLLVGTTAASFLSLAYGKPVIPVHHVHGHVVSVVLGRKLSQIKLPMLSFTISGGHTKLHMCKNFVHVQEIGSTIDDAVGEAYDKVAKMLGLGYPGGPIVSEYAEKGDEKAYDLPRIYLAKESLEMSFSGMKAAVYRLVESAEDHQDEGFRADVCASFQAAVRDTLVRKLERAIDQNPEVQTVGFAGGVSANVRLREALGRVAESRGVEFLVPREFLYCTDNAAMIGASAYVQYMADPSVAKVQYVDANSRMVMQ